MSGFVLSWLHMLDVMCTYLLNSEALLRGRQKSRTLIALHLSLYIGVSLSLTLVF